jgi:hypothetical protein
MKRRVAYAKSRYKDTVYETPLVVTSYRDEHGTSRNTTIVSLAKLPAFIVKLVEEGLKRGDPDTKRCPAGSLAEIWRELSGITIAKLEVRGKTHLKLSQITPYARKLLTRCRVPSLETLLSE